MAYSSLALVARLSRVRFSVSEKGFVMDKVLLVIGDGAEVIDTMVPLYRLGEDFQVVKAAPEVRSYHLVQHHHDPEWDITIETPGYELESEIAFRDVDPNEYLALVLPGGRAPEFLRYDQDLIRITRQFFTDPKLVASIWAIYLEEPLVIDGNLYCCRFKRECSGWMKAFASKLSKLSSKEVTDVS